MEVFHWPGGRSPALDRCVATLGVFDGVHVGHQRILKQLVQAGRRLGRPAVVITFDRHPHQVLGEPPQPCITSLDHRLSLFRGLGLDVCLVIRFTAEVARMEAEQFARQVFRDLLKVQLLIVGPDCRFGRGGEGGVEMCRRMSGELGLEARSVAPVMVDGQVVSSTAIRRAVKEADLARAEKLLGRPFSLLGSVVHGAGRGHDLGFPTANLDVHNELMPRHGVYATWLLARGSTWASVTSVGSRETFPQEAGSPPVVEVHLIDADVDLYGQDVEVRFVRRLRPQERFATTQALSEQIAADVAQAREALCDGA